MKADLNRRDFVAVAASGVLALATAFIIGPAKGNEADRKPSLSKEESLETWLLTTGRQTIDDATYSTTLHSLK